MNYRVYSKFKIGSKICKICIGRYSENLQIMFPMIGNQIIDIGEKGYRFFNDVDYVNPPKLIYDKYIETIQFYDFNHDIANLLNDGK